MIGKLLRGSWGSLLASSVLGGGIVCTGVYAEPITNHEFCVMNQQVERIECHAEHTAQRANCLTDKAFNLWVDFPDTELEYAACLAEASAACADCRTNDLVDCSTW